MFSDLKRHLDYQNRAQGEKKYRWFGFYFFFFFFNL